MYYHDFLQVITPISLQRDSSGSDGTVLASARQSSFTFLLIIQAKCFRSIMDIAVPASTVHGSDERKGCVCVCVSREIVYPFFLWGGFFLFGVE